MIKKFILGLFGIKETIRVRGSLRGRLKRAGSDTWETVLEIKNLVLNVGLAQLALVWGDGAAIPFLYGAIGSGSTAAENTDTALQIELNRVAGSFSRVTTTITNDTSQLISQHTAPSGGWSVREYGVSTAVTAGVFWTRCVFTLIPLNENDVLEMTYKNQIQRPA